VYTIKKQFEFSASHQLRHLRNPAWPEDDPRQHQCSRDHGHNYIVEVELQAEYLDSRGFVVDYGELRALKEYIDTTFDHRRLGEVVPFYTTAENLAAHFFGWCYIRWPQTVAVRVSETVKTWAEFRPERSHQLIEGTTEDATRTVVEITMDHDLARRICELLETR
jgi:6-pyruvoyltetrahydropterin/6-carboxytetrahydropterin synthase